MEKNVLKLFYERKKEFIDYLDTNKSLSKYLTRKSVICPLIGSEITLDYELGSGEEAVVFSIKISGETKNYAAKRYDSQGEIIFIQGNGKRTYKDELSSFKEKEIFKICEFNDISPSEIVKNDIYIQIPSFLIKSPCSKKTTYKRNDNGYLQNIPENSSICEPRYSEFAISMLVGTFLSTKKSINFIDSFCFATCPAKDIGKPQLHAIFPQYFFMEKLSRMNISDYLLRIDPYRKKYQLQNSIAIQLLHSIAVIQSHSIVHGDLHLGNVFSFPIFVSTEWNGEKLMEANYFRYSIGKNSIYIESEASLIKLGDWGFSVKYSSPMIGNVNVIENNVGQNERNIIPNFYNEAYDVMFLMRNFYPRFKKNLFIKRIIAWILNVDLSDSEAFDKKFLESFNTDNGRPIISLLDNFSHVSASSILLNKILMGDYVKDPPKNSKIITIGHI